MSILIFPNPHLNQGVRGIFWKASSLEGGWLLASLRFPLSGGWLRLKNSSDQILPKRPFSEPTVFSKWCLSHSLPWLTTDASLVRKGTERMTFSSTLAPSAPMDPDWPVSTPLWKTNTVWKHCLLLSGDWTLSLPAESAILLHQFWESTLKFLIWLGCRKLSTMYILGIEEGGHTPWHETKYTNSLPGIISCVCPDANTCAACIRTEIILVSRILFCIGPRAVWTQPVYP